MNVSLGQKIALLSFFILFSALFTTFAITIGLKHPAIPKNDIAIIEGVNLPAGQLSKKTFQRTFRQTLINAGFNKIPPKNSLEYIRYRTEAINDLLDRAWLIAEIKEKNLKLPKNALRDSLENIRLNQFPDKSSYRKFLEESRFNKKEIIERVRLQLFDQQLQANIFAKLESPSRKDIYASYKSNPSLYAAEDRRNYQLIVLEGGDKTSLEDKILSAKSQKEFKSLSEKYSVSRDKLPASLPQAVLSRLSSYSKGEIGGPVPDGRYFYFFQITDVIPGEIPNIKGSLETIRQEIATEIASNARNKFLLEYQDKWRYKTFCQEGFITQKCRNAPAEFKSLGAYPACRQTLEEKARFNFLASQGLLSQENLENKDGFKVPEEYYKQALEEKFICPPAVISRKPMPPGGNKEFTLSGEYLDASFLPQGPIGAGKGLIIPNIPFRDPLLLPPPSPADPYRPGVREQGR